MARILPILLGVGAALIGGLVVTRVWRAKPRRGSAVELDEIDLASDQSFPASDPPAWTHRPNAPIR